MPDVYLDGSALLSIKFYDEDGDPVDPTGLTLSVLRSYSTTIFGPYTLESDDIIKEDDGLYSFSWNVPDYITPGVYVLKWIPEGLPNGTLAQIGADVPGSRSPSTGNSDIVSIDGAISYATQTFSVLEIMPEPNELLDPPRIYGTIRESPLYRNLGYGQTDQIFLIGHASGVNLNDPMQVVNMQEMVNRLGADAESPLLHGLLEVYNMGARDIWIVAAAPMTEYITDYDERFIARPEWGGLNYYERYAERLESTYEMLKEFDYPEILVPLEAPFYDTGDVDFLTPLVEHCEEAFVITGAVRIGIIGTHTRQGISQTDIDDMVNDPRMNTLFGSAGKFSLVVAGEVTYQLPQMPVTYSTSAATAAAATLATNPLDKGLTRQRPKMVVNLKGQDLKKDQIKQLARSRINPMIRTQAGKRGNPYQVTFATDNTLSDAGSDYWSIVQMRLVGKVINSLRSLGRKYIGTIGYTSFKDESTNYMQMLMLNDVIRGYTLDIHKDTLDNSTVYVDVSLQPYFGVREISFQVEIGPG